jgi:hypothetical protein
LPCAAAKRCYRAAGSFEGGVKLRVRSLLAALAALVFVPSALAGGPTMLVGVAEDNARQPDAVVAKAKMDLSRAAGFDSVRLTSIWSPGQTAPSDSELLVLRNAVNAAGLDAIRPIVIITPYGSSTAPVTADAQAQFAQYAAALVTALPGVNDVIVGNEPNSNRFWLPQFNADGTDAAAQSYLQLLATTYDALKAVRSSINVISAGLAPRGADCATCAKQTHSPTAFITDLGAAYRASGRTTPVFDTFDMHVYEDYSALSPSFEHPVATTISVPDYGKLVSLLGQAFDGTAQPGSTAPILYGEFGVESIPTAEKASLYSGAEPTGTNPVDEPTQAAYYTQALKVAYCQPNVVGILEFKAVDESSLAGWQSGVYYPDETAKSSLATVRSSAAAVHGGTLTSCPDTTPPTVALTAPNAGLVTKGAVTMSANASDDVGIGKVDFLVNGTLVGSKAVPPYAFTWNSTGSRQVSVQARTQDAAHNVVLSDPVTITVDNVPPDTSITSAPAAQTVETSASFSFTATENATFECALDGAAWAACSSPVSYTGLGYGQHTFAARATDALGNVDATPATFPWTVLDQTPPETTIVAGPTGTTGPQAVTLSFSASEPSTFACSLDGAAPSACTSPTSYSGLAGGDHTFSVAATDQSGNVDATPATRSWTIDDVAPDTTITSSPPATTGGGSATFSFTATESAGFECALDGAAWAPCSSPTSYNGLAYGQHTFLVRGTDAVGNVEPTPASFTWNVVDQTPPETTITGGPSGTVLVQSAMFSFSASEPATFACSLDGAPATACTSPVSYSGLAGGGHTLTVVATDRAGNVDATPATRTWTIFNDAFVAAAPMTGATGTARGSNAAATREAGEPRITNNKGGRSVWFTWTAPWSGTATIDTVGSSFNTLLAVYTGTTVGGLRQVAANDNYGSSQQSRVTFAAVAGVTYRIAVDGFNGGYGTYVLHWTV